MSLVINGLKQTHCNVLTQTPLKVYSKPSRLVEEPIMIFKFRKLHLILNGSFKIFSFKKTYSYTEKNK